MADFVERLDALRGRFRERCRERVGTLQRAIETDDRLTLAGIAHELAGNGGIFGFDELSREAKACERAARETATSGGEMRERGEALLRELVVIAEASPA